MEGMDPPEADRRDGDGMQGMDLGLGMRGCHEGRKGA